MMVERPGHSLPKQARRWSDLKGAYRFLSNPHVEPRAIGGPHRALTRRECLGHPVVLCVQDGSDLQSVKVKADQYVQQSTLAVLPDGRILGLLEQRWYKRVETSEGETRQEQGARWRESDIWLESVEAVGFPPEASRWIHVADRAADDLRFMHQCLDWQCGFVVRARHDRRVNDASEKLWEHLSACPVVGTLDIKIGQQRAQRDKPARKGRRAKVAVRYATVHLGRPEHHPEVAPLTVQAVYLEEIDPPKGVEPVDWMVLSSEPVESFEGACRIVKYYQCRWVIEEWHRCLKEGCSLEESQVDKPADLQRLAALLSIIAVRMMKLRDLADADRQGTGAQDPKVLQSSVPWVWIVVVAGLFEEDAVTLTPRQFWLNIARQGGWMGRKGDGRPGWKVIWRGWYDISQMVTGAELAQRGLLHEKKCG